MAQEQDLKKLEQMVENLLGRFQALKREKNELAALAKAKDEKINDLEEQLNSLDSQRSHVHDRVNTLLSSIEEWEKNLDEEAPAEESPEEENAEPAAEESKEQSGGATAGQLFSMGE